MEGAAPIAAHLLDCSACASRLTTIQSRLAHLAVVLRDADNAIGADLAPHVSIETLKQRAAERLLSRTNRASRITYARHRSLGAAAAVLLFAGAAAAAVPALRGWIAVHWTQVATSHTTSGTTPLVSAPTPAQAQHSGAVVSFHPLGSVFVIRFDEPPAGGILVLSSVVRTTSATPNVASAEVIGGGATDELLVWPGELRIRNSASSIANYRVALPVSVHSVHIVFGRGASERGRVVELAPSALEEIGLGSHAVR